MSHETIPLSRFLLDRDLTRLSIQTCITEVFIEGYYERDELMLTLSPWINLSTLFSTLHFRNYQTIGTLRGIGLLAVPTIEILTVKGSKVTIYYRPIASAKRYSRIYFLREPQAFVNALVAIHPLRCINSNPNVV